MSWASITYTFSPSTMARASEVNQNFSDVVAGLDKAMPSGGIIAWALAIASIPSGWYLCDGSNGTPNLVGKFIQGAGSGYAVGATGGEASTTLSIANMPAHNHGGATGGQSNTHSHHIDNLGNNALLDGDALGSYSGYMQSQPAGRDTGNASADHTHAITLQGSGTAFENRPPFYTLAFIMKS